MTTQTEALKLADSLSELLESFEKDGRFCKSSSIRNELYDRLKQTLEESKEALAQPEQEPVAWWVTGPDGEIDWSDEPIQYKEQRPLEELVDGCGYAPLYTTPPQQELVCVCGAVWEGQELIYTTPQRTWVELRDEEIEARAINFYNPEMYKRAVLWTQEKLKEKNQ